MRVHRAIDISGNSAVPGKAADFAALHEGSILAHIRRDYVDSLSIELLHEYFRSVLEQISRGADAKKPGRGSVKEVRLDSGAHLVFRLTKRGGFVRHFVTASFLRLPGLAWSESRPLSELSILSYLYERQFPVPAPVAAAVLPFAAGLAYHGVLVTELIPRCENFLASLWRRSFTAQTAYPSIAEREALLSVCSMTGNLARQMLEQGVFHTDLHLGNILVTDKGLVYVIDFDKAHRIDPQGGLHFYARKLASRWKRSVTRHIRDQDLAFEFERYYLAGLFSGRNGKSG